MTIKAHFDGKTFIPDEPVDMDAGQEVTLAVIGSTDRPWTGKEIADGLADDPEIKAVWDKIATGRDSREVAGDLRRQAQQRGPSHDPD